MDWDTLEKKVPYMLIFSNHERVTDILGKKSSTGPAVWVVHPGKYWKTWPTPGGDFRVTLRTSGSGNGRVLQFRQVFDDWQVKRDWAVRTGQPEVDFLEGLLDEALISIIRDGANPRPAHAELRRAIRAIQPGRTIGDVEGIDLDVSLTAFQCMALSEHRRYGGQTDIGGGKYLLARVLRGILLGKWTAEQARQTTTCTDRPSGRGGGLQALEELEIEAGWSSAFHDPVDQ